MLYDYLLIENVFFCEKIQDIWGLKYILIILLWFT